jgi:hypothetical protein
MLMLLRKRKTLPVSMNLRYMHYNKTAEHVQHDRNCSFK